MKSIINFLALAFICFFVCFGSIFCGGEEKSALSIDMQKIYACEPGAGDEFGFSVSTSGDYAIVGAPNNDWKKSQYEPGTGIDRGAAYVYHKTGTNTWDSCFTLKAPDAQDEDRFGWSVAISGDYAVVGAVEEDGAEGDDRGAAYVYHRTGANTWDSCEKLIAQDGRDKDCFGWSVAIYSHLTGDYVIVGAPNGDVTIGDNKGAAYVFHRTGTNTWDSSVKLTAPDAQDGACFGNSVAISGSYAIIGDRYKNEAGTERGAAYAYHRTDINTWDSGIKLTAPDAEDEDRFGRSVAISGDYAIVGAEYEDGAAGDDKGAAYVFYRTGANTWDSGIKLTAPDAENRDYFGHSVAIYGDYAIIGAHVENGAEIDTGAAYVYRRTGINTWDSGVKLTAPDAYVMDCFGSSVAISFDYAIIGAYFANGVSDGEILYNCGAAYILSM